MNYTHVAIISPVTKLDQSVTPNILFYCPARQLGPFLQALSQFLSNTLLNSNILFVTAEHCQALPDMYVPFIGQNNSPTQPKRYAQIPIYAFEEDRSFLQQWSSLNSNHAAIVSSYVQFRQEEGLEGSSQSNQWGVLFQAYIQKWQTFLQNLSAFPGCLQNFDYVNKIDIFLKLKAWGCVNVSTFYKGGQFEHRFKTCQAGRYVSRGGDLFNLNSYSGDLFNRYSLNYYPLYLNGPPQGGVSVGGDNFWSLICADAISGLCNIIELQQLQQNLTQIPIIIQGDTMSPDNFFQNVFVNYGGVLGNSPAPQSPSYFRISYQSTGQIQNFPDTITLSFFGINGQAISGNYLQGNFPAAYAVLMAMCYSPYIVFADFRYEETQPVGGVYQHSGYNQSPLSVTFTKKQPVQINNENFFDYPVQDGSLFPAEKMAVSVYRVQ